MSSFKQTTRSYRGILMFIRTSQKLLASAAGAALMTSPAFGQDSEFEDVIIVTGVAKATTAFDSSASVSALSEDTIQNLAPRSVNELFRSLPGVKAEDTGGDANANIKVRGLPIASGGSRYFSIQENGFPTLLIGDTAFANYDAYRLDAEYGGVFGDDAYYHIGGFARTGEGVRDVATKQEEGYQIKATVGKDFDRGNVAVHLKHLNDRVPTYLPLPARVQSNGDIGTIGLDLGEGTNSLGLTDFTARSNGEFESNEEGFQADMTSIGFEGDYAVTDNVTVAAKGRYADISGNFYSPFPFSIADSAADGGENIDFALFNTSSEMDNLFGDVNIQGAFDNFSIKAGVEYANQDSEQNWNFNQARATLINGVLVTNGPAGGFTNPTDGSYIDGFRLGNPAFGNCCTREYDFEIEQFAPYISANVDFDNLTIEASYRRSENTITGQFTEASIVGPQDGNGDGTIASNEEASTQNVIQNSFDTNGIEIEGDFNFENGLGLRGNATFTDSKIAGPDNNANIGNTARRQAPYILNINPYYEADKYSVGMNVFSTGKAPVQDSNQFDLPAYTTVGAYINYDIRENMEISLNANNLFDAVGFSEGEEGAPAIGDFVRFRPINGRTVSATLRYSF